MGRSEDDLRADSLRLVAHDLNNPLTAIRILAEMLREEITDREMRQDMIDILEAADLASALMEGMSSLVQIEHRDEDYTWFPMDLVEVLRHTVDRPALRRHVALDLPHELQMGGDRTALQRAFTDVFVNARRLSDARAPVAVTARDTGRQVEVRIRHHGPGIPAASRDRLFQLFGAVELRQSAIPVSAVGLVYARAVFANHGGSIAFEDDDGGPCDLVVRLSR
ncbi:MAG: HAMP domain-containing sensor histidine kinase [Myxococcota bacterium]